MIQSDSIAHIDHEAGVAVRAARSWDRCFLAVDEVPCFSAMTTPPQTDDRWVDIGGEG